MGHGSEAIFVFLQSYLLINKVQLIPTISMWPSDSWQDAEHLCREYLVTCPPRESDLESARGWQWGKSLSKSHLLIKEGPTTSEEIFPVYRLRALKSPGRLWARLLSFYAKRPNRMKSGWKLHIIGTQKDRK